MSLTIAYITSRNEPRFDWFFDSLRIQHGIEAVSRAIIVDLFAAQPERRAKVRECAGSIPFLHVEPKPNLWQGKHRLTKEDWWAASSARNTAFVYCRTEWIALLDDRCVLLPGWLDGVANAMRHGYIVAGAYEKRNNLKVDKGVIVESGVEISEGLDRKGKTVPTTGKDVREIQCKENGWTLPHKCYGNWLFGCNLALPLVCALQVNGYPEDYCNGVSFEDVIFGQILEHNGFDIRYDYRMKIIEDRTPGETGPIIHRRDKGVSPDDKTHKLLEVFRTAKTSKNSFNLSKERADVLRGLPWPMPIAARNDWYDGQPISEMVPA